MERRAKGSMYKMKGSPMQRNFGIGSPLTKPTEPADSTATPPVKPVIVEENHWNYGSVNKDGTKIVNKQGNWVSLNRGTEGAAIRETATKSGHHNIKKSNTGSVENQ